MSDSNGKNRENGFEEALRQFVDARLQGQEPDLDEFVRQYSEFEDRIRQKVRNLQKIDTLFESLVRADEGDFEKTATVCDLVGRKLGHFEIREMIGRGGMGVVYLADDTRLDRSVAIKSMPPGLVDNAVARTRFTREAKLLASLSHPNIGVIHDIIEQAEGSAYLVLEYVPGETLAERITKGPLKLQEALTIALQIAEAMAAAHEHDVIHRDLKPGNIKITPDGRVKVLDFGLAKALGGEAAAQQSTVTQPGRAMGTPAYMSPEQARGKPTNKRSDIWSFGCVLYEMLTGRVPFEGETTSDTLANVLQTEPDWQTLPQSTPANIRSLLRRCLEKDPQRRLRDIGDASIEINETLNSPPVTTPLKLRRMAMIIGATAITVLIGVVLWLTLEKEVQPASKEIRLVVLPFENLGPSEDEYFADGIAEEIMSRLSAIHTLGVISRTSAIQYKNSNKTIQKIGEELGIEYVLEGTVRWERQSEGPNRVRVTPQLIRVSDDTHLWSERYDAVLADIFHVQSEIAEQVAQALDVTLLGPERRALASRPTENMEAYEYYLRGNQYYNRSNHEDDAMMAMQMYEKALVLDPTFALAYARLSMVHAKVYWFHHDDSEQHLAMAKQAVDSAFQLNPDLPEAHMALGFYHYWGHRDYDHALEQFTNARESQPNNSEILSGIGYVQRRRGEFEQAVANLKRACELDPLSSLLMEQHGQTFLLLRKYPEAERYFNRAIKLNPNGPLSYSWKAQLYLVRDGSTKKPREVLEGALQNRRVAEDSFTLALADLDVYDRNYQEALDRLSLKSEDTDSHVFYFIPRALRYARIYRYMKKKELAEKCYDEARSILESKIQERPEDSRLHSSLGIAHAGLGHKEEAIREGLLAVELLPVTKDAWEGLYRVEGLARIYVMMGEFDAAIDQLEFLLSVPGELSIPLLRLDPAWDPLRNHPRFKELLKAGR